MISWAFARAGQRPYPVRGGSIWVNAYLSWDPSPRTLFAVATMTAIVHDDYGTIPEDVLRLEEVGKPTIADDQVLVRVQAASVDRGTWHIMAGLPYPIRVAGFGLRRPKYLNPGRMPVRTYPLSDVAPIRGLIDGHARGKIVITMGGPPGNS